MTVWMQPPAPRPAGPVLFLDRDGVVIEDRHYLADPAEVVLVSGAAAAMARARAAGFALVGISNQSGIGRGHFTEKDLGAVMARLDELLGEAGAPFDAFYYCPHAPRDDCRCRKPRPGLLEEASTHVPWDVSRSWVVGDKASDIRLAREAGLGAVLVRTGYGKEQEAAVLAEWGDDPLVLVQEDLPAAVAAVLAAGGTGET